MSDVLAKVIEQERRLVFERFEEAAAFSIGSSIREMAIDQELGIVCDIRLWDRPLFYMALPGTTADNPEWVRRKANVVRRFGKSTYRMVLEKGAGEGRRSLSPDLGVAAADYVLAGGGFPVTVAGAGIIGAVTVSGVPEAIDHMLVVRGLCMHLGIAPGTLELPVQKP